MRCSKCGVENRDGVESCCFCGSTLSLATTTVPPIPAQTSGLAIASLVLAILSPFTCSITAIPAIILGIVALVKISDSAGRLEGRHIAIAAFPIAALSTLLPVMGLVRIGHIMSRMPCGGNLAGLGRAMLIYADEHENMFPTPAKWCDLLVERDDVSEADFRCPGVRKGPCNYAMNKNVEELGLAVPPDMVVLFETHPGWNQSGGPEILTTDNHGGDGCNVLFIDSHVDSHVEFVKTGRLDKLRWTAD